MIESLIIDNFRGIRHLNVRLGGRMNLFAGENGAGKSTVLQALRYLMSWYVARVLNRDGRVVIDSRIVIMCLTISMATFGTGLKTIQTGMGMSYLLRNCGLLPERRGLC